jgi:hypothetical protein
MIKTVCDVCKKEMTDRDEVRIWSYNKLAECCLSCFGKKKHWSKIVKPHVLKSNKHK